VRLAPGESPLPSLAEILTPAPSCPNLSSSCDSYLGADQTFDLPKISVAEGEDSDEDDSDEDEDME
jgi:hypothetical protein